MNIDSYESPHAESLLLSARERHAERSVRPQLLVGEGAIAALFLLAALLLAALGDSPRSLSFGPLAATVITYLIAARVRFPVGSAWTAPTQLAFVPMLFLLPTPLVPVVVAGCCVLDLIPNLIRGGLTQSRALARIADGSYSVGPALVLVLAGRQVFSWDDWPIYIVAFLAQVVFDGAAGLARSWMADRVRPSDQLPMLWLYLTDACLSCVGLLIAASAVARPGLVLLAIPLIALLWLFALERRERLERTLALSTSYRGTALLLGDVVETDDHYTGMHSRDVVDLSVSVADVLGLDSTRRRNVELAALLHDIGKIRVPKEIINKSGTLDADEWAIVRTHTIEGEKMLRQVGGTLASIGRMVRSSHERYDGTGYPDRLAHDSIPIESRIVCACDAFSAMTTDRPYRPALSVADALSELRRCAGAQFDPLVVDALIRLLRERGRWQRPLQNGGEARPPSPARR